MAAYLCIPETGEMQYFPELIYRDYCNKYQDHKQQILNDFSHYYIWYSDQPGVVNRLGIENEFTSRFDATRFSFDGLPENIKTAFALVI